MRFNLICFLICILLTIYLCSCSNNEYNDIQEFNDNESNINKAIEEYSKNIVSEIELEPVIASGEILLNNKKIYTAKLVQTKYLEPLTPEDEGFSMFNSAYYGGFDIVITNKQEQEIDRVALNAYFEDVDMGFIGNFDIIIADYNFDKCPDFAIGQPKGFGCGVFGYVLFSVDKNGKIINLPVQDGFLYAAEIDASVGFSVNKETKGIEVHLPKEKGDGYEKYEYIWEKDCFILKKVI